MIVIISHSKHHSTLTDESSWVSFNACWFLFVLSLNEKQAIFFSMILGYKKFIALVFLLGSVDEREYFVWTSTAFIIGWLPVFRCCCCYCSHQAKEQQATSPTGRASETLTSAATSPGNATERYQPASAIRPTSASQPVSDLPDSASQENSVLSKKTADYKTGIRDGKMSLIGIARRKSLQEMRHNNNATEVSTSRFFHENNWIEFVDKVDSLFGCIYEIPYGISLYCIYMLLNR